MTIVISDNSPRISYVATEGQTVFTIPFEFFDDTDVNLYINDDLKDIETDYTVSGGDGTTGTLILVSGASVGDIIVLTRSITLERATDFPTSGPFQVASLNTELDKTIAMIADLADLANRGLRLSDSDITTSLTLASPNQRKGTVLAFNAVTGAVEIGPTIADTNSVAQIKADISTVAGISGNVTTVAGISGNVTTVASNNANVTIVAGQVTNMQNITDNLTDVQNAATNATNAAASAAAASTSETNASTSEANAATSEGNAATSATNASNSASSASTSASSASTSASNAASSASDAATSETNAATSATDASGSASAASTSATNAATSASNASASASNASTSATNASSSATAAATSETNAATSETNAATSETNAATSASSASTSASTATTKASEAATSASNAATSETNAAASETNAASSASSASTSASSAATSATNASSSASSASSAQTAAEAARDSALAAFDNFDDKYLGQKTSDPTVDNDGDALVAGALYFNTTSGVMKVYTGTSWVASYVSGEGFATLTGATFTGDVSVPNLITSGNVDGRDVSVDGTKLDGIETGATADQTASEIKTAYESNANTNAFTDAEKSKLTGVETGATADQTAAEIRALVESATDSNVFTDADHSKLNGIEAGATADQTAAQILTAIKTVDGSGSGLDADLLDGYNASTTRNAPNTIPIRDASGYLNLGWINTTSGATTATIDKIYASQDSYIRYVTPATLISQLGIWTSSNDGAGSGLDADNLDGFTWTSSGKNVRATEFYADNWFRNYNSGEGLYNEATGQHFYSDDDDYWNIAGGGAANGIRFRDDHNSTVRGYVYSTASNEIGFLNSGGNWSLRCDNSGNVVATGNVTAYSDERLKSDIETLDGSKVYEMRGVSFTKDGEASSGVIAQELQKVAPELVNDSGDYLSVAYGNLVGYLIEAVKELKAEVEQLKSEK